MATSRVINTGFWKDSYIIDLNPSEKLLFIYFLTNPRTSLAGIYEISLREVEFDTGIDQTAITNALSKFQLANKMYYEKNWLILTNFIKHQRLNPSIIRGIEKAIDELPDWLQTAISLEKSENDQLSLFMIKKTTDDVDNSKNNKIISVEQQTVTRLTTVSPQYKEIKSNLIKLNLTKRKNLDLEKNNEQKPLTEKQQKRNYAIAMDREREQQKRAEQSKARDGTGLEKAKAIAEKIRLKKAVI